MIDMKAIRSVLPAKYGAYFSDDSPFATVPSLSIDTSSDLAALVAAILALESIDQGTFASIINNSPGTLPSQATWSGIGLFSEFDKAPHKLLTFQQMRRIWMRRVAVSLWSDVGGHWSWGLLKTPIVKHEWNVLLGWNPEPDYMDDPNSSPARQWYWDPFASWGVYPKGWWSTNGNYMFYTPAKLYHFSTLWDPNPFLSWHIAYRAVRPFLSSQFCHSNFSSMFYGLQTVAQSTTSVPSTSRLAAILSLTSALRRAGIQHYMIHGFPQKSPSSLADFRKFWPQLGNVAPGLCPSGSCVDSNLLAATLAEVWQSRITDCLKISPLFVSVLRAMNVPAHVARVVSPPARVGESSSAGYVMNSNMMRAVMTDVIGNGAHHTVISDCGEAPVMSVHGDDLCSYFANRFADPQFAWVGKGDWLSRLMAIQLAKSSNEFKNTAWQTAIEEVTMLREVQNRAALKSSHSKITMYPWSDWLSSYTYALTKKSATFGGKSWLEFYDSAKNFGAAQLQIAISRFFQLDYQLNPDPTAFAIGTSGPYGHWGLGRFPANVCASSTSPYGLGSDPDVQNDVEKLVSTFKLLWKLNAQLSSPGIFQ